jgi:hypothetical protein
VRYCLFPPAENFTGKPLVKEASSFNSKTLDNYINQEKCKSGHKNVRASVWQVVPVPSVGSTIQQHAGRIKTNSVFVHFTIIVVIRVT